LPGGLTSLDELDPIAKTIWHLDYYIKRLSESYEGKSKPRELNQLSADIAKLAKLYTVPQHVPDLIPQEFIMNYRTGLTK
jgi:hypothetical protein